jgi:voltage-gated potassium channel
VRTLIVKGGRLWRKRFIVNGAELTIPQFPVWLMPAVVQKAQLRIISRRVNFQVGVLTRKRIFEIIERSKDSGRANAVFDWFLMILICLNVIAVISSSIDELQARYNKLFNYFEYFSIAIFTIEYLLRIWTAPCKFPSPQKPPIFPYLRYIFSFMGIIDLCAILPFYLPFVVNVDLRVLRILRLFRLLRVLKLTRYNNSLKLIDSVLNKQKDKLYITIFFMLIVILLASTIMYFAENTVQPDKFPNIPATLWWAVATLTTVGYGDVYPVTVLGKLLGGLISIMGIGLIAMPSGIISMGLIKEVKREKKRKKREKKNNALNAEKSSKHSNEG